MAEVTEPISPETSNRNTDSKSVVVPPLTVSPLTLPSFVFGDPSRTRASADRNAGKANPQTLPRRVIDD